MLAAPATTRLAISSLLDGEESGSNGRRSCVDAVYVHSCDLCRVSHTGHRSRECVGFWPTLGISRTRIMILCCLEECNPVRKNKGLET
jgi:hypothetical protein